MAGAQDLAWPPEPQIHFGNFKAITGAHQHLKPLFGLHVVAVVNQQAVGGRRPPTDPAPQLVELGQAKTLGMVDHHHTRLGHIHTHLHHRGAHKHLGQTIGKSPNGGLLAGAVEFAVEQAHLQIGEHLLFKLPVHLDGRAQIKLFGFLHQGQHHVGPLADGHLVADQLVGLAALPPLEQAGLDGLAPGR